MIDLLKVINSKQVFIPPKQDKGINIEDAQSTKLFHKNA